MKFSKNEQKADDSVRWYSRAANWFSSIVNTGLSFGASFYIGKVSENVSKKVILSTLPRNPASDLTAEVGGKVAAITAVALYEGMKTGLKESRAGNILSFSLDATITSGGVMVMNEACKYNTWLVPVLTAVSLTSVAIKILKRNNGSKVKVASENKEIKTLELANIVRIEAKDRETKLPRGAGIFRISLPSVVRSQKKEKIMQVVSETVTNKKIKAVISSSAPIFSSLFTMLNHGKKINFVRISIGVITGVVSFVYRVKKEDRIRGRAKNRGLGIGAKLMSLSSNENSGKPKKIFSEAEKIARKAKLHHSHHISNYKPVKNISTKKNKKQFSSGLK